MLTINELYKDYKYQSPQKLKAQIESELSDYFGTGYSNTIKKIRCAIDIATEYTNKHQKKRSEFYNSNGEFVRKSGEPYINHTLRVALLLINERICDDDVICAAIMHDLFEDTTFTYEQAKDFDIDVADLIQCVTNVAEYNRSLIEDGISPEEIDYAEMISKCNNREIAFYIKFADRLDNLMTLDSMSEVSQAKKIDDTKNYMFPILEHLKATRFYAYIKNAVFMVEQRLKRDNTINEYLAIESRLNQLNAIKSTKSAYELMVSIFKKHLSDIQLVVPTIYEINQQLKDKKIDVTNFKQSDFTYNIYFIAPADSVPSLKTILSAFVKISDLHRCAISSIGKENNRDVFDLIDDNRNRYHVTIISNVDYTILQYGQVQNELLITSPAHIYDDFVLGEIIVFTPKNEKIKIAKGSTIVDFAFRIHNEIGAHLVGAKVNDQYVPIHTKLKNYDKVEVFTSENAEAQPNWLLYCKTEYAKRAICKLLRTKIDYLVQRINELEKTNQD